MTRKTFVPGKTKIQYGGVAFGKAERTAIEQVLDRNWWGLSRQAAAFETELAKYNRVKRAIFVNSGSSALLLAFAALQLPPGSEIIVPAVTFPTPVSALLYLNLVPVVVDVDIHTYNLDTALIERVITKKTKAILAVHVAGNPVDMPKLMRIAKKYNLHVVEDNCDAFGGQLAGKMLGAYGDLSTISTHAAHMISTGEGGVVFTNSDTLAERVYGLRDWGRLNHLNGYNKTTYQYMPADYARRYIYDQLGFNVKPLELQAAMGRVQLRKIGQYKRRRKKNFDRLYRIFSKYPSYFDLPTIAEHADPCWYTFAFLVKNHDRKNFTQFLDKKNIEWRNILAGNIAKQPAFINRVKTPLPLINADEVLHRGLWISVHPLLTRPMLNYIARSLAEYFA